jgi:hypothetical protein
MPCGSKITIRAIRLPAERVHTKPDADKVNKILAIQAIQAIQAINRILTTQNGMLVSIMRSEG